MPELPEVEITARRLSSALEGAEVESALAAGVATLKTFEPSLDALKGARSPACGGSARCSRSISTPPGDGSGPLTLLIHLMSAGRLQLFDKRASLRDRRSRLLVRIADGRELRLREFGTKQSAWAKLLPRDAVPRTRWSRRSARTPGRRRRSRSSRSGSASRATSIPCCATSG